MGDVAVLIEFPGTADWKEILGALRVLNEQQYLALVEAPKIRAKQEEAVAAAVRDAERIRADAREDGMRSGREEALREWGAAIAQWRKAVEEVREHDRRVIERETEMALHYAAALAEWILRRELADPVALRRHLAAMLAEETDESHVVVRAHPQQIAALEQAKESLEALRGARIEADRTLNLGDLILEYHGHQADCRIRTMLDRGVGLVLEHLREGKG
jgi:hypothetical protein